MACKSSKISKYINYTIKVTTIEGRNFVGKFLAFDKYMNMILSETIEKRTVINKKTREEKEIERSLGMMLLRGDCIQGYTVLSPPPKRKQQTFVPNVVNTSVITAGPQANPSLVAPTRGVGIPQPLMGGIPIPSLYPQMGVVPPGQIPVPGVIPGVPPMIPGAIPPGIPMYPPMGMIPPIGPPPQMNPIMPQPQPNGTNPTDSADN
ncbi:hypothetical protein ENUP19_0364G0075 [Entamoeba nuttalli]|uniref:Sm protein B n=2 Tax=Entamoeba nuttalli TaxID=412467 RepID=K2H6H7_ENTNP|nr:LSM domain containing protein [Entamoeba nuttalli P19]EKE42107.1 LSM domain containing protein [Entamoeba nuttalli P19]|eukprot:XP_008855556.1 LSM domain containing protein [Entamoeba nuttalli P19]